MEDMDEIDEEEFTEFLNHLSVFELATLSFELRKYPQDKKYLNQVLVKIGERNNQAKKELN
jgi:hypothetical protein